MEINRFNSKSPLDSSIDSIDDLEIDELSGLEDIPSGTKKRHFLDYDNFPPNGYDEAAPVPVTTTTTPEKIVVTEAAHCSRDDIFKNLEDYRNFPCRSESSIQTAPRNSIREPKSSYRETWPKQRFVDLKPRHNSLPSTNNTTNDITDVCPKLECVYSLMSMLGNSNDLETSIKFLELSKNREMSAALRKSGCIPMLVQIIHSDSEYEARKNALLALHNVVITNNVTMEDKVGKREAKVLKLIEQLIEYCDYLREAEQEIPHPIQAIGTLMKISFDEEHRNTMCQLGALQTISSLVQLDHAAHGTNSDNSQCITARRYAGMILTNLTFGDGNNKALLCSNKCFMKALVLQISSSSDELVQVTASVLRNLSWRADSTMKQVLSEIGTVKVLTNAAMLCKIENTLKAILSALWNLSNHCPPNKSEFCEVEGAIEFLVDMLTYEAPSKTMSVIENAGGILRNISSQIAIKEEYRVKLRKKNCLGILLQQLKSPSLTVVSNACGTLGNLSAENVEDQKYLRENGAIPMLRSLIYSKHKMISTGSSIALRNLLNYKTSLTKSLVQDSVVKTMDLKELPTLNVRKQKALEQELSKVEKTFSDPVTKEDEPVNYSLKCKDEPEEGDEENGNKFVDYQETDIDQITDYSLRYAENQSESDEEKSVDFIPEDSVKCYYTEGTPRAISSATSMTDLRIKTNNTTTTTSTTKKVTNKKEEEIETCPDNVLFTFCDEGTPKRFSGNDSFSSLDLGANQKMKAESEQQNIEVTPKKDDYRLNMQSTTPNETNSKSVTFANCAEETPLMFSRTSSMGSLSSAEPNCTDDKSSIISDFSRLASGIISPSELPDSPTQSIPNSPRRAPMLPPNAPPMTSKQMSAKISIPTAMPSAFDDQINNFNVENTPAEFSCATSLSKLSIEIEAESHTKVSVEENIKIEKVEPLSDAEGSEEDEILLQECIGVGMSRVTGRSDMNFAKSNSQTAEDDVMKHYCTENTPARLSKIPSTSDLSVLSLDTSKNGQESDDSLDNGSDKMLEECIREGMPKAKHANDIKAILPEKLVKENPLGMLRNSAHLPPYLPDDEMNSFHVEDSPCAFSAISALSDITVGSDVAALATIKRPSPKSRNSDVLDKGDDSLSSLSMESDDELLNQAIAAGIDSKTKTKPFLKSPSYLPPYRTEAQADSSSIDSCDSNDHHSNSLLEQCIQNGMKPASSAASRVPTFDYKTPELPPRTYKLMDSHKSQNDKDDELLLECIKSGMPKSRKSFVKAADICHKFANLNIDSKNEEATSANTKDSVCATDVSPDVEVAKNYCPTTGTTFDSNGKVTTENGFEETVHPPDKHKDPELMLKSVDRFTQELVSTAEYLRAKNDLTKSISTSNNTWNEDESPNNVSFPSVSETAPKAGSVDDDDITISVSDNDYNNDETICDDFEFEHYEEITPTNEYKTFSELEPRGGEEINFHVGGEVKHGIGTTKNYFFASKSSSTMTNSTIIAVEATKVANNLQNLAIAESAGIDLDEIIPPFESGSINLSEYLDVTDSSTFSIYRESRKHSLKNGILVRKALGSNYFKSGSVESINSINNLDNVAPPSIMDELMDSMISVASITSEIEDQGWKTSFQKQNTVINNHEKTMDSDGTKTSTSAPMTPKQRRQNMKDRYKTYVIPHTDILAEPEATMPPLPPPIVDEKLENGFTNEEPVIRKSIRQKRQENKSRYETQVIETSNLILNIADSEIIASSPESQNTCNTSLETSSSSETPKCKIVTEPKSKPIAIRGTKKSSYISPYRKTTVVEKNKNKVQNGSAQNLATKKEPTTKISKLNPFKAPQLIKNKLFSKKSEVDEKAKPKLPQTKPPINKATPPQPTPPKQEPLVRQGTFVKDEPTNTDVPIVTSEPSTPSKKRLIPPKPVMVPKIGLVKPRIGLQKSASLEASKTQPTSEHYKYRLTTPSRTSLVDYRKPSPTAESSTMIPLPRKRPSFVSSSSTVVNRIQEIKSRGIPISSQSKFLSKK